LLLSAFFSGAETSLFSLSKLQKKKLERKATRGALTALALLEQPRKLLITILIGNVTVNTLSSIFATSLCLALFGDYGIGVAVPVMTILLLIFGELSPKVFAFTNSERFSVVVAMPLKKLSFILAIPIKLIHFLTDSIINFLAPLNFPTPNSLTSNEFEMLFKLGAEAGEVRTRERKLVGDIFDFEETVVREVMTPRVEIDALKAGSSLKSFVSQINQARSARMPVYSEDIDDIYAILDTKRFLLSEQESIEPFCSVPFFVPESKRVKSLFQDFRERAISIAVVLDEYGGVVGIISLEDILEELFGEVYDENEPAEVPVKALESGGFRLLGKADIDDVLEETGISLSSEEDEYDTVAGFCMARIGRIPREGEEFVYEGYTFRVLKTARRTVFEVRMTENGGVS
jgi:CBS domain containing-hemolysin-like protein